MRTLIAIVLVVLVAVGVLAYWQGWFTVTREEGGFRVKVDPEKFKKDRAAFGKAAREKTKAARDRIAGLWKKTEGLTGDEKARAEKELSELEQKHELLEKQIRKLDEAGEDQLEGIRQDLSQNLADVDRRIDELTKKLDKGKGS
jgi:hypothetical protein